MTRLDSEKTVATVSTVVSVGCFDEWAYFPRRLSGSTHFTVAVEGIFGRRKGGAGWRAVARDQQKEEGGLCSEMEYINTEQRVEDTNRELTRFTRKEKDTKRNNKRLPFTKKERRNGLIVDECFLQVLGLHVSYYLTYQITRTYMWL